MNDTTPTFNVWFRRVRRHRTGPWRFFFCADGGRDRLRRCLRELDKDNGFEHLALPSGEFPDEASRVEVMA